MSKIINNRQWIDSTCFVEKNVLSKNECNKIIDIAKKYEFYKRNDMEKILPEYQIEIFDNGIKNGELWNISKKIYDEKLERILRNEKWLSTKTLDLNFVFMKRYSSVDEKPYIPLHLDESYLTMSFLLSNKNDFDGGELYVFDLNESNRLSLTEQTTNFKLECRNEYVNNHKNLPVLKYNQGDLAVYTGGIHMHGILPVTRGERYILTFFFV